MLQYLAHNLLLLWPFVLVPGKKKGQKKKTETTKPAPPKPVVDRNAEETQTASERLWPAVQRAMLQAGALGGSTEAPSQD